MGKMTKIAVAISMATGLCIPAAQATNGMFLISPGIKSSGIGGVAITMSHDTLTSAVNPATLTGISGNRFDIGGDIFTAPAEATMGQGIYEQTAESKPDHLTIADGVYVMPNLGMSWQHGDISYGFTMLGVGGGGSRYDYNLFNCANDSVQTDPRCSAKMGVSLVTMNINPTIAMKINENHSVGASLIIGMQVFKSYGLSEFTQFTADQTGEGLTDEGTDLAYGAGVRLGWMGSFMNKDLILGAAFSSQTYMSKFDSYNNLFAEGRLNTPGNIGVGASYKINDELTIAMDINYIMYEDVAAIANDGPPPDGGLEGPFPISRDLNALGEDEGLGFGWSNQTAYKVGVIYQYNPQWTLRGGWNYGESPIDEETDILFSTVAPAIVEHHLTLGGTYQYSDDIELSFSYVHAFENEQFGPTYINYGAGYTMSQHAIGASFAMKF